ncbi:metal-dependent hydrolase [Zavarzinia sp.]|uniref:metal-dependent hydrolase n=1 Tax=Zavarzinia sp. TaxID=2027920 RepID=UPI0035659FD4
MASLTTITPRNMRFAVEGRADGLWCGGDPVRTAFFDGMSIMFPEGEKFFIESVKENAADLTDPVLRAEVQNFAMQEGLHSREHHRYNDVVAKRTGAVVTRLEEGVKFRLDLVRRWFGPKRRLAATAALEHFTAILADYLLTHPEALEAADPEIARLWLWHAIEENEHKAVAFDVMAAVAPGIGGYFLRTRSMVFTTLTFSFFMARHILAILRADLGRRPGFRHYSALLRLFWGRGGVIPATLLPWLAYFRPGFHPWDHDNRKLLDARRESLKMA